MRQWIGLAVFVIICLSVGVLGSVFTAKSVRTWYQGLEKPSWNPPDRVFGPVWTVLYLAMAVAAWLVWRRYGIHGASVPLILFAVQLALNLAWSVLFFGMRMPGPAFGEIILLWCAILATLIAFWRLLPAAGWLMLPYLLWVTYAVTLNFGIWRMNRP